jgi:hypothetical protein
MIGHFGGMGLSVVDIFRWASILWSLVAIAWLAQIAVVARGISTTFLVLGFALSLIIDIGDQYIRIGAPAISYRLPVTYGELAMISLGVFYFAKARRWSPVAFFFFVIRQDRSGGIDT